MSKAAAARRRSPALIIVTWICSVLSVGLLLLIGEAVRIDVGGFRPCSTNRSGLSVSNCGKTGINLGDLILLLLFVLAACLVIALFTAAWRMTRRPGKAS